MAFGFKSGYITGDSMIEYLGYQNKDTLLARLAEKTKAEQELIRQHPELLMRGRSHRGH
jgi:hypothetical protein